MQTYQKKNLRSPKTLSGKPFKGILLTPIEVAMVPAKTGENLDLDLRAKEFAHLIREDANKQLFERYIALGEHYGVEPNGDPL